PRGHDAADEWQCRDLYWRLNRLAVEWDLDVDQIARREMLACIAATVRLVDSANALAAQAEPAEFVLVAALAGVEVGGLVALPAPCGSTSEDVRRGRPHPTEPCTLGPNRVVHLPARTKRIALVGRANCLHHVPTNRVTKVRQRVERLEAHDA